MIRNENVCGKGAEIIKTDVDMEDVEIGDQDIEDAEIDDQDSEDVEIDDQDSEDVEIEDRDTEDVEMNVIGHKHVKNEHSNIVYLVRHESMDLCEVERILKTAETGVKADSIMTSPPVKPKGGEAFLYKCKNVKDSDFLCDQYAGFLYYGNNKKKFKQPSVLKIYYKLKANGKVLNFQKHIYRLTKSTSTDNPVVLMHYLGKETLCPPKPHGNSKIKTKYFCRNTKTFKTKARGQIKITRAEPKSIYYAMIKGQSDKTRDPINKPRNIKQIRNIKRKVDQDKDLLPCELFSVIEMGKNKEFGDFVVYHELVPYHIIIVAHPSTIDLANFLLKNSGEDLETEQLLSYDTTFNCGDAYVSTLVMRNTLMNKNPIFGVLFMLHDRKVQNVHDAFLRVANHLLQLDVLEKNVPICIDRETALTNAIKKQLPCANIIYCHNHIIRDMLRFIGTCEGKTRDDFSALEKEVKCLLNLDKEDEFENVYKNFSETWSEVFKNYFEDFLKEDIRKHGAKFVYHRFPAFLDVIPTNNLSESLNKLIKEDSNWKELRLHSLVTLLLCMQLNVLHDFGLAFTSPGNMVLKEHRANLSCPIIIPKHVTYTHEQIIETLKATVKNPKHNIEKGDNNLHLRSKNILANITCNQNLVSVVSASGAFIVNHPFNNNIYTVTKNEKRDKLQCTCESTGLCFHIIAVQNVVGKKIIDKSPYNLLALLKRTRGHKGKTGRKAPKPQDILPLVEPADDSLVVSSMEKSLLQADDQHTDITHDSSGTRSNMSTPEADKIHDSEFALNTADLSLHAADPYVALPDYAEIPENISVCRENLEPKQWLDDDILNSVIPYMINSFNLEDSVLYFASYEYTGISRKSLNSAANFLSRTLSLNRDLIIVLINTDPLKQGSHWALGIIALNQKTIYVVDSLYDSLKSGIERENEFQRLLAIAATANEVADVKFVKEEWKLVLTSNFATQSNGYDCGPLACLNMYMIITGTTTPQEIWSDSKYLRFWINRIYESSSSYTIADKYYSKRKRIPPFFKKREKNIISLLEEPLLKVSCHSLTRNSLFEKGTNEEQWTMCDTIGCILDPEHDDPKVFCVVCRLWYHTNCIEGFVSNVDYHICHNCKDRKLSSVQ